jgi:hypothetical protein
MFCASTIGTTAFEKGSRYFVALLTHSSHWLSNPAEVSTTIGFI